ncbi:MAG: hypothetical protein ABF652_09525 [Clostridium beijerinckii]
MYIEIPNRKTSSIFNVPYRQVVYMPSHKSANVKNKEILGNKTFKK